MGQPPRKKERAAQLHIYMPPALKVRLQKAADRDHRSLNMQMLYYIERGVDQDDKGTRS